MEQVNDVLGFIANNFKAASAQPLKGNYVAETIRKDCAQAILRATERDDFLVKGAPGEGNWADVPWIGLFNPEITSTATQGIYVVYLFSADLQHVCLSLGQGVTEIKSEFGRHREREMLRRAELIRDRVPEHRKLFSPGPVTLGGTTSLSKDYDPAVAFYRSYRTDSLPSEQELRRDLSEMVGLYDLAISRGGTDNVDTAKSLGTEDPGTIEETRRYVRHTRIERHSKAADRAKQVLGCVCQACGFDFEKVYGERGRGFIEAHHLIPLSTLPEGKPVPMDPAKDFAVLCANCHRMVHRHRPWISFKELKSLLLR